MLMRFPVTRLLLALCWLGLAGLAPAAEKIPPAPKFYFNDYAGLVTKSDAQRLNAKLEQFEKDTSNQLVVAIYPKMESNSDVADYTVRIAQAWQVGQKKQDNGVVLFVFVQDHKIYLQVGYGLEGALPDLLASRIIQNEITPRFKAGQFAAGIDSGINAIIAATRGEYKGTGTTVAAQKRNQPQFDAGTIFLLLFVGFIIFCAIMNRGQNTTYTSSGRRRYSSGNTWGGFSSGGGGGGFSSGGGGGGFSGGGGSFGGGGAGGSW